MPDMNKLEINGVVYDVRDPTKAPAGHGLGAAQYWSGDLDTLVLPGWYYTDKSLTVASITAGYWYIHVSSYSGGTVHCTQKLYPGASAYAGVEIVRTKISNVWQPADVSNPPMVPGQEYRTRERYNNKPVYCKLVNFGALPNNTSKNVVYYGADPGASAVTSLVATLSDGNILHAGMGKDRTHSGTGTIWLDCTKYNIRIVTDADFSGVTAMVAVKYTKD